MDEFGEPNMDALRRAVQHNCDVSDARHASDYSMCVYLMKMRELYRWEHGLDFTERLEQEAVGEWLRRREERWADVADARFERLPIGPDGLDVFDSGSANEVLNRQGLVYSAGYGRNASPHFVLARLARHDRYDDFQVYYCEQELARDLAAPPAMTQGDTIFLRQESIRRMVWEKIQESDWHAVESPTHRALRYYGYQPDSTSALDRISSEFGAAILDHEIGEHQAGTDLGPDWEEMLFEFRGSRSEHVARAARDLLADALVTLPRLLDRPVGVIHYYAGTMTAMRRHLFPAFHAAYQDWLDRGHLGALQRLIPKAQSHWREICRKALQQYQEHGAAARIRIESLIEEQRL